MQVTNYQIEKVLNVYTRKLGRASDAEKGQGLTRILGEDHISLSAEGKRRAVLERVSAEILGKLVQEGSLSRSGLSEMDGDSGSATGSPANAFVFNVIGEDQEKATTALSLSDEEVFMQQLTGATD